MLFPKPMRNLPPLNTKISGISGPINRISGKEGKLTVEVLRSSLDGGGNDHNDTAADDGEFATIMVRHIWSRWCEQDLYCPLRVHLHDGQTGNTSDAIQSRQKTKIGPLGIVEVGGPLREDPDVVQHRPGAGRS